MKKFKKVFAVLLLMLLVTAPVVTAATQPVTVEAAAKKKTKLKKVKGKYYAYENGKKVSTNGVPLKWERKNTDSTLTKKAELIRQTKLLWARPVFLSKKSRVNIMDLTIRDIW